MDIKKLAPWNWFKKENGRNGHEIPVKHSKSNLNKKYSPNSLNLFDNEYTISLEIPGVSEKDVSLELLHDTLMIRGEKKQEKEERNKHFYRLERSYGSFQRTLSLPEDADKDKVRADFKNGVLKITIPRMGRPENQAKQIEIKYAL